MYKLLVDAPNGVQEVVEVAESGGYFDTSRVLWDERADGPMPQVEPGGLVRSGADLVFSQARLDEHDAAVVPVVGTGVYVALPAELSALLDDVVRESGRSRDELVNAILAAALAVLRDEQA